MAVDFNAAPTPEGLALAAQLRNERRQRDKVREDRIAEAETRDVAAGRMSGARAAGQRMPALSTEIEESGREQTISEAEVPDVTEPRSGPAPVQGATDGRDPAEPDSTPKRDTSLSFRAQLEALASSSRPRQSDRQR